MRKIKWGVLGTAYIFERDVALGMKQAENCELYAIAGRSMEKALAFQEKYGFQAAYGSYDELIDDPQVEAIYNPLPNSLHHEWTIKALKAGKHVLCEKPIAATLEEAREMYAAARENGVCLMEAFAYLHSPYINAVSSEIRQGAIGKVRFMETVFATSDYNQDNIRMRRDTFGGCLYDLGVYCSSLILRVLEKEPDRIQAVSIFKGGVDTYTSVLMEYGDGLCASFGTGMVLATEKNDCTNHFQIHGEKGSLTSVNYVFNAPGELSYRIRTFDGRDEIKTVSVPQNYQLEVEQFGRCIANGEAPAVSEAFSLANMRTIERILKEIGY